MNASASKNIDRDWTMRRPGGGAVGCNARTGTSVIKVDITQALPLPEGFGLLDDLVSELACDPEITSELVEARKELGRTRAESVGETLATLRLRRGMSQTQLADAIGSKQPAISRIESGEQEPVVSTLRKLARALQVDYNTLINALPDA